MLGQEPGEGWQSTDTFGRLQNSVGSIAPRSVPPVGPAHQLCPTVAAHCHLRRQPHASGAILHVRGPLGQAIAWQVNHSGPG